MDGAAIVTIQKGSLLEVIGTGKNETIDGIDSSWVNVKVLESTRNKDGRLVQEETEGWCFGGYLTSVKWGEKYEICFPGVGTQSVVINTIHEYNRDGKEIYTRTSDGFEKWFEYDENGRKIYMHICGTQTRLNGGMSTMKMEIKFTRRTPSAMKSGMSMMNMETRFTRKTLLVMRTGIDMIKTETKFTGKFQTGMKNGMNMMKMETKFTGKLQAAVNNGMNMMKMETKFTGKLQTVMKSGLNMMKGESSAPPVLLNLASEEYAKAVRKYLKPGDTFITCVFAEQVEGALKEKGVYVKMARGEMVRFMAENNITRPEELKAFSGRGYRFSEGDSSPCRYVFKR